MRKTMLATIMVALMSPQSTMGEQVKKLEEAEPLLNKSHDRSKETIEKHEWRPLPACRCEPPCTCPPKTPENLVKPCICPR